MSPVIVFLARRLLFVPITLLVITAVLYASTMLVPPERRAFLYLPPKTDPFDVSPESPLIQDVIEKYHLRDPFPVQYLGWLGRLLQGDWGWGLAPSSRCCLTCWLVLPLRWRHYCFTLLCSSFPSGC